MSSKLQFCFCKSFNGEQLLIHVIKNDRDILIPVAMVGLSWQTYQRLQWNLGQQPLSSWTKTQPFNLLNGWVCVYGLSGCWFKFCCSHWNFRYQIFSEQRVYWSSSNYGVRSHYKRAYDMIKTHKLSTALTV